MTKKVSRLLFFLILGLALTLRIAFIGSVPPSPSLDEASIGYNAFSILKTGKDEYGYFLPLLLRAYDDYRPALYVYTVIPFVAVLGPVVEAVRIPSVIFSMLSVVLSYYIARIMFRKEILFYKYKVKVIFLPILTMLLVSISPWQIYISRLGHEVNLALFVTLAAIYFFLKAANEKKQRLIFLTLSVVFFAFCFYSYQAQKIIVPLLLFFLLIIYWRTLREDVKKFFLAGIVGLIMVLPAIYVSLTPEGLTRLSGTSVFTETHPAYSERLKKFTIAKENNDVLGQIVFNRRLNNLSIFTTQYISHFNPLWLFLGGPKEDHKVPNLGLMFIWEVVFIAVGFLVLIFSDLDRRIKSLLLLWILISPLAASITTGAPHAMRSLTLIPAPQIIASLGVLFSAVFLKKYIHERLQILLFVLITILSIGYFSYQYFIVFPKLHSVSFQYPLNTFLKEFDPSGKTVIVSNRENLTQSYMFYLFASRYDPQIYQSSGGTGSGGFAAHHQVGLYSFRPINYTDEEKGVILVGSRSDFPGNAKIIKTYSSLDGLSEVIVVEK